MEKDGQELVEVIERCVSRYPVSESELIEALEILSKLTRVGVPPMEVINSYKRDHPAHWARENRGWLDDE